MTTTCSVPGCHRDVISPKGALLLCTGHYTRLRRHGDVRADVPIAGRADVPVLLEDTVDLLQAGESPEQIAARLARTPGAIARAAYRARRDGLDHPGVTWDHLAREFGRLERAERRRRGEQQRRVGLVAA